MTLNERNKKHIKNLVLSAFFLSLCIVLPFITGQVQTIGKMLLPMHLPVLICGVVCGPWWGAAVGLAGPILRALIVGMPPVYPTALSMAIELCAYAIAIGLLYQMLPKKTGYIYVSLLGSMAIGRVVMGVANVILLGIKGNSYSFSAFIAGAFTTAVPGIILQIILVPIIIMLLKKLRQIQ